MRIDAYIFDLDGTLIDTEMLWADAMCNYLQDHKCECERSEILEMVFGRSWIDIHATLTRLYPALASMSSSIMGDQLRDYYLRVRQDPQSIIIRPSVAQLRNLATDHPVIIVSGSPAADIAEAVDLMQITNEVKFYLGAENYSPGKPSPAGFLKGAEMLGVDPSQCLVFEDSWAGITAAKAAGMWCVELTQCARPDRSGINNAADWTLTTLADFSPAAFADHVVTQRQR